MYKYILAHFLVRCFCAANHPLLSTIYWYIMPLLVVRAAPHPRTVPS